MHRYNAQQILHHPWITGNISDPIPLSLPEMYKSFSMRERVTRIIKALMVIKMMSKDYWRCVNTKKIDTSYLEQCNKISQVHQQYSAQIQKVFYKLYYIEQTDQDQQIKLQDFQQPSLFFYYSINSN